MSRNVAWTAEARADIENIARHIALDDQRAAERVAARIFEAGSLLARGVPGRPGRIRNTFEKVVGRLPYVLCYEVVTDPENEARIIVLHVIHGARDWAAGRWPDD